MNVVEMRQECEQCVSGKINENIEEQRKQEVEIVSSLMNGVLL